MAEVEILEKVWEDEPKKSDPKKRAYDNWAQADGEGQSEGTSDGSRGAAAPDAKSRSRSRSSEKKAEN